MKRFILAFFSFLIYSSYSQASLLSEFLNDSALDAINCNDLNYNHDNQKYNLSISFQVEKKEIKKVTVKKNYEQEILVVNKVTASSDLRTFNFSDYELELTEKQYFNSHKYWAILRQSNSSVREVVCSFSFQSTGE
jgi:pyruvate formate-lyase activating enzyme-like uncharacterized protein